MHFLVPGWYPFTFCPAPTLNLSGGGWGFEPTDRANPVNGFQGSEMWSQWASSGTIRCSELRSVASDLLILVPAWYPVESLRFAWKVVRILALLLFAPRSSESRRGQ